MEKKKIVNAILIVVLVVLGIFIGNILRKMVIVAELQAKLDKYQTETNVYRKTTSNYGELDSYERYYKDGVSKEVITNKKQGAVITQYTYENKRRTFWDMKQKIYREYDETTQNVTSPLFIDYLYSRSAIEMFLIAKNKITTEDLDGKECYVISGKNMPNMMLDVDAISEKIYIEKDTGIILQITSIIEKDGTKKEKTIKYEYSIGTVTDEDMKEPDTKNYKFIDD